MKSTCTHLDLVADVDPGEDVCPACVAIDSSWLHLRQCRICGNTACCDTSLNKHATAHFRDTGHPIMRTLEADQDWSWCFIDEETLEQDADGRWRSIDGFFDAGVWFARGLLADGTASLPFAAEATAGEGFPLGVWEATYRRRHRDGTIDPEQAAELESLPGWRW
ncbi:MAG: UBP-type zinc finger domain-containing protein [Chloroflexi bacterium]|nr:UBP-type zinc finger domain-containing protein [Chloroflexota bacterium]